MARSRVLGVLFMCLSATAAGCAPVIRAERSAPNPLAGGGSLEPVVTRPRNFEQKAVYDRLDVPSAQFHAYVATGEVHAPDDVDIMVQIWHPWSDLADLRAYKITLRADQGPPVPVDSVGGVAVTAAVSRLNTNTVKTERVPIMQNGRVVGYHDVTSLGEGSIEGDLWRGRARLRFRGQPLLTPSTRALTLELRNAKQVFLFVWRFEGGLDGQPKVATGAAGG